MKKFTSLLIIFFGFAIPTFSFAAQMARYPVVTEKVVSVMVNTNDKAVVLEVINASGKTVAGPTTTTGVSPITATIDVYDLARGTTYILKVTDKDTSLGDEFKTNFTTSKNDTRLSGSGDWYYTTNLILNSYDGATDKSMLRFTDEKSCNTSRTTKLDELLQAESVSGGGVNNSYITPCFKSTTFPTKGDFESRLQNTNTLGSSKPLFYFTWKIGKGVAVFNKSAGYDTLLQCENEQKTYAEYIIMACTPLNAPPVEPMGWNDLVPQGTEMPIFEDKYKLLAPLGRIDIIDDRTPITDYLNMIFKIAIGLCGALAVIMIVVYGIAYMGDESVFGKTEAKHKIMGSIFGLLLALGAYVLLNTINPDFVNGGLKLKQLNVIIESHQVMEGTPQELDAMIQSGNCGTVTGAGVVVDPAGKVQNKICPQLERGRLKTPLKGIVLHRTAGSNAAGSLAWWVNPANKAKTGAHFLIDKDGAIWQTARIDKYTYSVGATSSNKYPTNSNSISIEVVGKCVTFCTNNDGPTAPTTWEPLTNKQLNSTEYLVNYLIQEFKITKSEVYTHEGITNHKHFGEGQVVLDTIKAYLK